MRPEKEFEGWEGATMDISYLLFLQDFRNGIDNALTPLMDWGKLLFSVIYPFYFIALFPLVLKVCSKRFNRDKGGNSFAS